MYMGTTSLCKSSIILHCILVVYLCFTHDIHMCIIQVPMVRISRVLEHYTHLVIH